MRSASRNLQQVVQVVRYQRAVQQCMVVNVVSLHSVVSKKVNLFIRVFDYRKIQEGLIRAREMPVHIVYKHE